MAAPACSDQEFISLYQKHGAAETARILQIAIRNVYQRRRNLERAFGYPIISPHERQPSNSPYPTRMPLDIKDGIVIVGSDVHVWPGDLTTAQRGFIQFCKELKPKLCVLNGDVLDGARISRHPKIMWAQTPTVKEELDAVEEFTDAVRDACKSSKHLWLLGNHCMRFETKLANDAGAFEGVSGFSLREQFPAWDFGLSAWVNNLVVIKHRFKGGIHATHTNALWSGKTMVTGHLHSLKVTPFDDYNGRRYGIDTGTLAEPYGEHAAYAEDNPLNHRSGFIVLTFYRGILLWPEVVAVLDADHVEFRGKVIKV